MVFNISLSLIFLFLSFYIDKKLYSPRVLFFGLWSCIFIAYSLQIYKLQSVSATANAVFAVTSIGFFGGSLLGDNFAFTNHIPYIFGKKTRQMIFWIFVAITYVVLLRACIEQIRYLLQGLTYYAIFNSLSDTLNELSGIWVPLTQLIAYPVSFAISPICAYQVIVNKKWKMLAVNLSIIVLYTLYRGERGLIFFFLASYLIMYFINANRAKKNLLSGKEKRRHRLFSIALIILFIIGIYAIIFFSASRGIEDQWASWYVYLVGAIPHLSILLKKVTGFNYGLASLQGLITPILTLLHGLGIMPFPQWYLTLLENVSTAAFYNISASNKYIGFNAYVGPAYYNYLDFGFIGVLIGVAVFGFLCQRVFKRAMATYSRKDVCLYLLLACNIVFSMERNWFFTSFYTYAFIYIWFFTRDKDSGFHSTAKRGIKS